MVKVVSESLGQRLPPHFWFVGSAVFHYLGPSFAVLLFSRVPVGGVAWLRIASAGLVFFIWRQPWRTFFSTDRKTRHLIVALGFVFAIMNYTFYMAIDRLPLGTVASIEFAGPIALALTGSRTLRNLLALVLAAAGVYLLTDVRIADDPAAFGWAFGNAAMFTLYIIVAHALARSDASTSPVDRLAAAMIVATIVITPLGFADAAPVLLDGIALMGGIGVGVTSSVIPYVFDQMAMIRLSRATYSLFTALLPATAVVVGVVVLTQIPRPIEVLAVALVIVGVLIHHEPSDQAGSQRWQGR